MSKDIECSIGESLRIISSIITHVSGKFIFGQIDKTALTQLQFMILKIVHTAGTATGSSIADSLLITRGDAAGPQSHLEHTGDALQTGSHSSCLPTGLVFCTAPGLIQY